MKPKYVTPKELECMAEDGAFEKPAPPPPHEMDKSNVLGSFYDPREGLKVREVKRTSIVNHCLTE